MIAVQKVDKYGISTLPGGGIEPGESEIDSLIREIREEVGAIIDSHKKVATILEVRQKPHAEVARFNQTKSLSAPILSS